MLLGAQKQTEQLHRIHYSETIFYKVSAKFGILHLVYLERTTVRSNLCDLKHEIQIQTFENERELSDVMEKGKERSKSLQGSVTALRRHVSRDFSGPFQDGSLVVAMQDLFLSWVPLTTHYLTLVPILESSQPL
ncbi:hypothetical protein KQX54_021045 [Cotesia glomerata]|uniref:Uncharacterized protein n=1 Tax=Cotesia glomerata TaxID=32391 RepID=A0AAV7J8A3_COTGL|nr:hypothetical protein KQX54_021045 [Cotesia glomerata]